MWSAISCTYSLYTSWSMQLHGDACNRYMWGSDSTHSVNQVKCLASSWVRVYTIVWWLTVSLLHGSVCLMWWARPQDGTQSHQCRWVIIDHCTCTDACKMNIIRWFVSISMHIRFMHARACMFLVNRLLVIASNKGHTFNFLSWSRAMICDD